MFNDFQEACDAFTTLADNPSEEAQERYEAAEEFLLTTPPRTLLDCALALRCVVSSLASGGRVDELELEQSARIQRMMSGLSTASRAPGRRTALRHAN